MSESRRSETVGGSKTLILGTALWGWRVDQHEVFSILDHYAESSGKLIDCAANYPINKVPADHGLALKLIAEWLAANAGYQMGVMVKLGSTSNDGSSHVELGESFLRQEQQRIIELLGTSTLGFSVHWDKRRRSDGASAEAFAETLSVIEDWHEEGYAIGFSGVEDPGAYFEQAKGLAPAWWIQVKENVMDAAARERYSQHFPSAKYFAYGINLGGLTALAEPEAGSSASLRKVKYSPQLLQDVIDGYSKAGIHCSSAESMSNMALRFAHRNKALAGVVAGPSNVVQLRATLELWHELNGRARSAAEIEPEVGFGSRCL